jgi:hypothetical protein
MAKQPLTCRGVIIINKGEMWKCENSPGETDINLTQVCESFTMPLQ